MITNFGYKVKPTETPWAQVCCFSLLPALLLVVVIFRPTAGGRPLGAAVLLGLLQELVQTERILLKLNGSLPPLPMICTRELFVRNKPDGKQNHHYGNFFNQFGGHNFYVSQTSCVLHSDTERCRHPNIPRGQ